MDYTGLTYTEVLTVILKYRMWYDEIECNRKKDTGNGLPTLNGQSEPFYSDIPNSLIRNEPNLPK